MILKKFIASKRTGWSANTLFILLFFAVIFIIVAAFMPAIRDMITEGVSAVAGGVEGTTLTFLFYAVPILLVLMLLYAVLVAVTNR